MAAAFAFGVFCLLQLPKGKGDVELTDFSTTQRFVVRAPSWPFRNDVLFVEAIGQVSAPVRMTIRADGREMREMLVVTRGRVAMASFGAPDYGKKELEVIVHPSPAQGFISLKMQCGR